MSGTLELEFNRPMKIQKVTPRIHTSLQVFHRSPIGGCWSTRCQNILVLYTSEGKPYVKCMQFKPILMSFRKQPCSHSQLATKHVKADLQGSDPDNSSSSMCAPRTYAELRAWLEMVVAAAVSLFEMDLQSKQGRTAFRLSYFPMTRQDTIKRSFHGLVHKS